MCLVISTVNRKCSMTLSMHQSFFIIDRLNRIGSARNNDFLAKTKEKCNNDSRIPTINRFAMVCLYVRVEKVRIFYKCREKR